MGRALCETFATPWRPVSLFAILKSGTVFPEPLHHVLNKGSVHLGVISYERFQNTHYLKAESWIKFSAT